MGDSARPFTIAAREEQDGAFKRQTSRFRGWIGATGPVAPARARYHLYVCRACPWAHRTLIGRVLMGLEDVISVAYVDPIRDSRGWAFTGGQYTDPVNGFNYLSQAYIASDSDFHDRVTVPVLWDRIRGQIVNNESADIFRMLHTVFAPLAAHPVELYPTTLAREIDTLNDRIYDAVNNGVYKAGFSTRQTVYEEAVSELFTMLDELDGRLTDRRFLFGPQPLETDWRLFTTLIRFDAVYQIHFKCSRRKIAEYANLWPYLRDLYQWPGIRDTVSFPEIRAHYYRTHPQINPSGIVAVMPDLDFNAPSGREQL